MFQTTRQNISLHLKNIFAGNELARAATVKQFLTVQTEDDRTVNRKVEYYNLDTIISIGYRVKSAAKYSKWSNDQRNRDCATLHPGSTGKIH